MIDGGDGEADGFVLINANSATTNGYVGIGKMVPNTKLHVKGDTTFEDADSTDVIAKIYDSNDDGIIDVYANNSVTTRIHGNGDSYFTGKVGIGTTGPVTYLHIDGTTDSSLSAHGLAVFGPTNTTNITIDQNEIIARNNGANATLYINHTGGPLRTGGGFGVNATPAATAGHIRAGNDIVAFYSDERLKEKITIGIENPIDKIKNINTFTYRHNELANTLGFVDDKIYIGVGAKAVKESLPEAVEVAPFDANEDGSSKSGEDYLTVQYERLVPLLIEAIKEQQVQIDELKQEIKEIKNGTSK
jgi:hypothetical protein